MHIFKRVHRGNKGGGPIPTLLLQHDLKRRNVCPLPAPLCLPRCLPEGDPQHHPLPYLKHLTSCEDDHSVGLPPPPRPGLHFLPLSQQCAREKEKQIPEGGGAASFTYTSPPIVPPPQAWSSDFSGSSSRFGAAVVLAINGSGELSGAWQDRIGNPSYSGDRDRA